MEPLAERPVGRLLIRNSEFIFGLDDHSRDGWMDSLQNSGKSARTLRNLRRLDEWHALHWWGPLVIPTSPGSGKSRDATELVTAAWEKADKKGLYLMLTNDAIDERLEKIALDGNADLWTRWQRHDRDCERGQYAEAGYVGRDCTCGRPEPEASGPTIATLEYILPNRPSSRWPLIRTAEDFDFWIIDEMDLQRLLGKVEVPIQEIDAFLASSYSVESVKTLVNALRILMEEVSASGQERLNGSELYVRMAKMVRRHGRHIWPLANELGTAELPRVPWVEPADVPLPQNFPLTLVPVLLEELRKWHNDAEFNPRVHIAPGPVLRVWWRKQLDESENFLMPPTFVLDATPDPELLPGTFNDTRHYEIPAPDWPENVHVHHWGGALVSRGTLGLGMSSRKSKKTRRVWYDRIGQALSDFPRDWPVGIITHKVIWREAVRELKNLGFEDVRARHYGDERGSNVMEDARVLVLLGLPIPNVAAFQEEAEAFLHDEGPLDVTFTRERQYLQMRDGQHYPVTVGGYWAEPVASYYKQKCQFGLYQALHRIRPYVPRDYDRHIFIYTNMPVPGVVVDEVMTSEEDERMKARWEAAVSALEELMAAGNQCSVPELATRLVEVEGSQKRALTEWVRAHATELAEATRTIYEPGDRGRAGQFARHAIYI